MVGSVTKTQVTVLLVAQLIGMEVSVIKNVVIIVLIIILVQ